MDDFAAEVRKAFDERMRIVMANRETYIAAWVAQTGISPEDAQLVTRHFGDGRSETRIESRRPTLEQAVREAYNRGYADGVAGIPDTSLRSAQTQNEHDAGNVSIADLTKQGHNRP